MCMCRIRVLASMESGHNGRNQGSITLFDQHRWASMESGHNGRNQFSHNPRVLHDTRLNGVRP